MTNASEWRSGKGHRDENFPVASWIIHPRHRALILAFYNFVRTADDIADHETLSGDEKLALLDLLEAELLGKGDSQIEAVNLRRRWRSAECRRAMRSIVLIAFRMDVTKLRYETWDEVIHYCRYSAMPVGRFMLDVHGEEHIHLGGVGCTLCRPANQQSPSGLRQRFQKPQPRLSSARCARRRRRFRRAVGRGACRAGIAAMSAIAGRTERSCCSTRANRWPPR